MAQLGLGEGQRATLKSVSLPLGRFIKIQPQELAFLDLSNPKAVYVLPPLLSFPPFVGS